MLFKWDSTVGWVLKVGVWRSQITFTPFYLWDITLKSLDTFSLGPVVATQNFFFFLSFFLSPWSWWIPSP